MPKIVTVLSVIAAVLGALLGYTDMLPTFWAAVIVVGSAFFGALSKSLTETTNTYLWTILGIIGTAVGVGGTALQAFSPKFGLIALAVSSALIAAGKALTPKEVTTPLILIFCLVSQACGKESIENAFAKAVVALRSARQVTTVQHKYQHIDDAAYKSRLVFFDRSFDTIDAVGDTIAGFGEITPGNKQEVLDKLNEAASTVDQLIANGDVGVTNPQSQIEYRRWLLVAKSVINSAKIAVAALQKPVEAKDLKIPKTATP